MHGPFCMQDLRNHDRLQAGQKSRGGFKIARMRQDPVPHSGYLLESPQRQRFRPPPELAAYIDNYLYLDISADNTDLPRLLPGTGAACFFFYGTSLNVRDHHAGVQQSNQNAFLICNRHHVLDLSASAASGLMVVNFRPGRLWHFTDASFAELQDKITPLADLWGSGAQEIIEQLATASNVHERAALLSYFFLRVLRQRKTSRLDLLLDMLYLSPTTRIADLAEQGGWSLRHFERQFAATYGVTPKYFARVARLQQVARKLALEPASNTLESALDAGFFDQSHFIHELDKLAGLSSGELARGVRERPHFYNPKALQWYLSHIHTLANELGTGDIPLHLQIKTPK